MTLVPHILASSPPARKVSAVRKMTAPAAEIRSGAVLDNPSRPTSDASALVAIGKFGKSRGLHGDIYVRLYHAPVETIKKYLALTIFRDGVPEALALSKTCVISGQAVAHIENVSTPEVASTYTNREVFVREDELPALASHAHYVKDLIGCAALDTSGVVLGMIVDALNYPANDVLVIRDTNEQEVLFPVVDLFVKEINVAEKKVTLDPPAGFFD